MTWRIGKGDALTSSWRGALWSHRLTGYHEGAPAQMMDGPRRLSIRIDPRRSAELNPGAWMRYARRSRGRRLSRRPQLQENRQRRPRVFQKGRRKKLPTRPAGGTNAVTSLLRGKMGQLGARSWTANVLQWIARSNRPFKLS